MAPELQQLIFLLLSTVITVAVPVLTVKVIAYLEQKAGEVGAKLTVDQIAALKTLATYVIQSVQQSGTDKLIEKTSAAKKAEAIDKLQRLASEFGLPQVSVATLSDLIESGINQGLHEKPLEAIPGKLEALELVPLQNYTLQTQTPVIIPKTDPHGG